MDNQISMPTASAEFHSAADLENQFFYPSAYVGSRQVIQKDVRIDAHSLFSRFTADIITSETVFTR